MKTQLHKKYIIFTVSLCLALLLMFPQSAAAVSRSSQITTSVISKSLTLTVPPSIAIDPIDVSPVEVEASSGMGDIEIADLRGKKVPLGWSLTVTATDFKTPEGDTIPIAKFAMEVNLYRFIKGADGGITIPGRVAFTDTNNDGASEAATLLIAKAGSGAGHFSINPILKLLIPAFTVAGNYQSVLTLTLS